MTTVLELTRERLATFNVIRWDAPTATRMPRHQRLHLMRTEPYLRGLNLTPEQTFWMKVGEPDEFGCWPWLGGMHPSGHGTAHHEGRSVYAHRLAYESLIGPIPPGLQLDHLCRNPSCVNPLHLDPVTSAVNTARGVHRRASATACERGHEYREGSYSISRGARRCNVCRREDYLATRHGRT